MAYSKPSISAKYSCQYKTLHDSFNIIAGPVMTHFHMNLPERESIHKH